MWFSVMFGLWICLYEICEWYKCNSLKVLWTFTQKVMKYNFKKVSLLNASFCIISIISAFLYQSHSSLLFTGSVGYACLKDVINGNELDISFTSSIKGIFKLKDLLLMFTVMYSNVVESKMKKRQILSM